MSNEVTRTNCLICKEKFGSTKKLDLHIKVVHLRMYVCSKCPNFSTMIKMRMTQHNSKVHYDDDENIAKSKKRPADNSTPSDHSDSAKQWKSDSDAEDEIGPRFECDLCWFTLETQEELDSHVKDKHGAKAEDSYASNNALVPMQTLFFLRRSRQGQISLSVHLWQPSFCDSLILMDNTGSLHIVSHCMDNQFIIIIHRRLARDSHLIILSVC